MRLRLGRWAAGFGVGGTWVCVWACTAEWGSWCRHSGCGHRRGGDVSAGGGTSGMEMSKECKKEGGTYLVGYPARRHRAPPPPPPPPRPPAHVPPSP